MEKYDKTAAALVDRSYQTPEIVNQRLRTLNALALRRGESVLDAGCGTGLLLEQEALAVGKAGRAEGLDFSEDMLEYAGVIAPRMPGSKLCESLSWVCRTRATPKSKSIAVPSGLSMTLPGFTSACTIPQRCAYSSALPICLTMSSA